MVAGVADEEMGVDAWEATPPTAAAVGVGAEVVDPHWGGMVDAVAGT